MADSALESHFQSDALGLRQISSLFFNFPGFLVGFCTRTSDSDSIRSPTAPIDFNFFSSLSNTFGRKSRRSATQNGSQKKWSNNNVGLGIINLLADENKPSGVVLNSPERKNIIFGSQLKTGFSVKTHSLPRDYMLLLLPTAKTCNSQSQLGISNYEVGNERVQLDCEPFEIEKYSPVCLSPKSPLTSKKFCLENRTSTITSVSFSSDGDTQTDDSLEVESSSLPVPIGFSHGYVGSLSACEIELSEDYTCIISYGPNPKTTHIFGDCILGCHTNELSNFDRGSELPQEANRPDSSTPYPPDEFLSFCYTCKKRLETGDDIYMCRGEKIFCCFDCCPEEIFCEDETKNTYNNAFESSSNSSFQEDIFLTELFADIPLQPWMIAKVNHAIF